MWLFQRQAAAAKARAKAKTAARKAKKKRVRPNRPYDPAKVKRIPATPDQIDQLIALSKGRVPLKEGEWFYRQFISFSNGLAKTPAQVRKYLSDAHWVEEDDLRQQVRIILWLFDSKGAVIADEFFKLTTAMRIYLIRDAKVFQKDRSHLQAMYQYDIELSKTTEAPETVPGLDIVFDKHTTFSTFDKYVIYLYHCLGQTEKQLGNSLLLGLESARSIKQSLDQKIKEQESINGKQNTKRHRQPTLAVFTSG